VSDETRQHPTPPRGLNRREALTTLGAGAFGLASYGMAPPLFERFRKVLAAGPYRARFFTEAELTAVRVLADMIIPTDYRSGSATDAGTVEYADFVLSESGQETQRDWHDGLAWLDATCWQRSGGEFIHCSEEDRAKILDDIAWPDRAREEYRTAARWFNRVRDLVGSGFFSSQMGVQDVGYIGGVFNPNWQGAPPAATRALGVSYDEWDRKYGSRR
jgi:Gluconate 2-dehydrogenase subunit 3